MAAGAVLLTALEFWEAAIVAAILAPTDAALGQAVVASRAVPARIRQALSVESGLNVEIVGRLLVDDADVVPLIRDDATWTKRRTEVEALFEPDCAVIWIAHGQRPIEATGVADARQGWLDWLEPWETYRVQIERVVPVGDRVVVLIRVHGRMAGTQNDVELLAASIYVVRDRRVARIEHYADRAEAFQAAGLPE
jgi:ketosteroid isomerase-like protein